MIPRRRHSHMLIGRATESAATVQVGTFVSWPASTGTACGLVTSVQTSGLVPGISHACAASEAAPAARVQLFAPAANGAWESTTAYLGFPTSALTPIDELPQPAAGREALVTGSFDAIRTVVRSAIEERIKALSGVSYVDIWMYDIGSTWAVYCVGYNSNDMWLVSYTLADDEQSCLLGDAIEVRPVTLYQPVEGQAVVESVQEGVGARVLEAKGKAADGGHIFRVVIIAYGDSKNGRRYPEAAVRAAVAKYEGSKAYDHHRTEAELQTSTIDGLVGTYRNCVATGVGIEADLHLLPSATHAAEALSMALANAANGHGTEALIGISHDVMARWKPITVNGRSMMEAVEILSVNSNDLVAHPAAGGQATRMVAAIDPNAAPPPIKESTVTLKELIAAWRAAESAKRAELLTTHAAVLESSGMTAADFTRMVEAAPTPTTSTTTVVTAPVTEATAPQLVKGTLHANLLIRTAVEAAGLGVHMVDAINTELPSQFTEADISARVASIQTLLAGMEKAKLAPTVPNVQVLAESLENKVKALDAMFAGNFREGFRSLKQAYLEIAPELGNTVRVDPFSEGLARQILRESAVMSVGGTREAYDSDHTSRASESISSTSWGEILGDSITRRMVAEYGLPSLQTWRPIVSSIYPTNDFRSQRIDRMGGYGVLPTVNQGAAYQPLTSPTDEEATYAVTKRGGLDDLTLEAITNDDMRAVLRIPVKLARAAAQTLYRFVWDFLNANAAIYDTVALFHAGHANTNTLALSGANLSTARRNMRKQTVYGDSSELLSIAPKFLIVVSELEELAFELATSAVAMPSGAPVGAASNVPNIHQGITPIVVDYWTSTTQWITIADPAMVPTIELGFLGGQEEPALFVQSDPTNGSAFTADKITYKIRHIYGGAVLDYRGMYRGNV